MKLTSRGRYALQALADLMNNSNGKAVKLLDISNRQSISLFYLEQLFRQLRQKGVVKSVRGPGGGYVLAREASNITVMEVLSGVKELTNYSNATHVEETSTKELKALASYLGILDTEVGNILNKTLDNLKS